MHHSHSTFAKFATVFAIPFAMLVVGISGTASAQTKPYLVTFRNTGNAPVRLSVTFPFREDLGLLRVGEGTQIDFNFNEQVQIRDARSGQLLQTHVVKQSKNLNVGTGGSGNPSQNPPNQNLNSIPNLPNQSPNQNPNPPSTGPALGNLQAEIQSALNTVNTARAAQGKQPFKLDARLQQAAERRVRFIANQTKVMNDVLHTTNHLFIDPSTGQRIGMNKWVREAGYRLSPLYPDSANHVENTYGEGSGGGATIRGSGARVINAFLGEGPGGGHYRAMMSDHRDFAFAVSFAANKSAIVVCVLVSSEDQAATSADPTTPTQTNKPVINSGNPVVNSGNPVVNNAGTGQAVVGGGLKTDVQASTNPVDVRELVMVIENRTNETATIDFVRQGSKGLASVPAHRTTSIQADQSSPVAYSAGMVMGQTYLTRQNQKLLIDGPKTKSDPTTSKTGSTVEPAAMGQPSGKPIVMKRTLDRRGYYNNDNGRYYNYFPRNWVAGRIYKVTVESSLFAPVVLLRQGVRGNHVIDSNPHNSGRVTFQFTPKETKTYSIHVTSKHQLKFGNYKLTIEGE